MKLKVGVGVAFALLLVVMSASRKEIPSAHAQDDWVWADAISIEPSLTIIAVGQTVKVNVTITNIADVYDYQFWIYYNSTILELVSWTFDTDPANPLSPTQIAPSSVDRIDIMMSGPPGTIKLATQWKDGVPTYSGSGVAAQLTFNGTMIGNSPLIFDQSWTQWNTGSQIIDCLFETFNDGEIQVRPYHQLTVTSSPLTGITFTINGNPKTTPYTEDLLEGSYTFVMPKTHYGYVWSHWLEDVDTNRIKTINLQGTTWTALYVQAVGGKATPINKLTIKPENTPDSPTSYIGLTILLTVATATVIYVKKRKKD